MTRKKWWIAIVVIAAIAYTQRDRISGALSSAPKSPAGAPVTAVSAPRTLQLAAAELLTIKPGEISRTLPVTGTLKPVSQILVKSKVSGDLKEVMVREGMAVRAGQIIARVDPVDYQLRVSEREAQLRNAQAQVEQARRTQDNNRQLLAKGFISQNSFDNSSSALDVARANADAAAAGLAQLRKALADTVIVAPIAGTVAERFVQPGEKVSPDGRVMSIVDLSQMEIEVSVPTTEISSVRVGQEVELRIDGAVGTRIAKVARINPGTQAGTRSVPVYLAMANREETIRAGMFAQGTLTLELRSGVLTVPVAAVRDVNGRKFVYALADGKIVERDVKLGARDDSTAAQDGSPGVIEVLEGLHAGEQIVPVNLGTLPVGAVVETAAPRAPSAPGAAPATRPQ